MLLLLIVSLMALFALIAITYVVTAGQHKRTAKSLEKYEQFGNDPKDIADAAFYQLVCGTQNERSVMQWHDLLGDMYGHIGLGGTLTTVQDMAGGEMLELRLSTDRTLPFSRDLKGFGHLSGCVISMLNGQCAGLSTHIIWQELTDTSRVRIRAFNGEENTRVQPAAGDKFWINGQPFSGTGFGYDPSTHKLDMKEGNNLVSKSPNFAALLASTYRENQNFYERLTAVENKLLFGGANEEYDAADGDNMALAYAAADAGARVIPSFHRPGLLRGGSPSRFNMLRPSIADHPNFTGSNPSFDPVDGPWDVDNDHDGQRDSIWIDPGLPPQTAPDGRLYKNLVAIMCMPIDGATNLNASGTSAHAQQTDAKITLGIASGPADINPTRLTKDGGAGWFKKIVGQKTDGGGGGTISTSELPRYGADGVPGKLGDQDRLRETKRFTYPRNWIWEPRYPQSRDYGTPPPEQWPGQPVQLNRDDGQPMWKRTDVAAAGDSASPYELDLSRNAPRGPLRNARDNPFTIAEYERCLRRNDGDARLLPQRLWNLLPDELRERPRRYTVESWDVPQPNVQLPLALRQLAREQLRKELGGRLPRHYVDILRARIRQAGGAEDRLIQAYCTAEMRAGLKFNLNRMLGNGKDDNSNGVIDEGGRFNQYVGEAHLGELVDGQNANLDNDDPLATDPNLVRDIIIRNLYVLALTLVTPAKEGYDLTGDEHAKLARQVAQWATNVIDFRDRDSVCTRFQYDPNPFDGWSVQARAGNATSPMHFTVFGCERPELIITEALAGHDFRTTEGKQAYKPNPWILIELYNPWTDREAVPGEFYQHTRSTQLSTGVVLDREGGALKQMLT
ncbi:MAG: hypothetical protein WD176_08470, partial [Pirellulales bacterium]